MKTSCFIFACFIASLFSQSSIAQKTTSLSNLKYGDALHGFKATVIYLNDADEPMGGRFIHIKTGFTLDLLQIESVPQAFFWVNTFPVSDKGEPHTQEHLLITKGNKGRELNTREGMSIAQSNAFTSQLHTAYDFYTGAGAEIFYTLFEKYLDALLYPDYTDEEVRREVRNWGITQNADSTLRIEEKGSVYTEMVTAMNNPYSLIYDTLGRMLYGTQYPLSYNAGGLPSGIRELTAQEILKFHNSNYYLGNMGAITSVPQNMPPDSVLNTMNFILNKLNDASTSVVHTNNNTLPELKPAAAGEVALVNYPSENTQEPGTLLLAYPAVLKLNATEDILLSNFLSVFAGDATTNLYKIFVDSKTKVAGIDAQSVYAYDDNKEGQPVYIGLDGIKAENLTTEKAMLARQLVMNELQKIAAYKDDSPELIAFNERFMNSLTSLSRSYSKFVNSPPGFGFRNTYDAWYDQLQELNKINSFKKSVVLKPQIEEVKKILSGNTNIWRTYLQKWNLTTATPYTAISKANASLIQQADSARKLRAATEVARLKNLYHLTDEQETIRHYNAEYDSTTTALEKLQQATTFRFIDNPPLTLDDQLNYKQETLQKNIPLVTSVFNNMTSATAGIALNINSVPQNKLLYLAILPDLLTQTGIIKNGNPVSYDSMSQMLKKEILSLDSYYSGNPITGRAELVVKASGNDAAESQRAITWINDVLESPNWTEANLPRIRDLVEQELSSIRKTEQNGEEYWVNDPGGAYLFQNEPLELATSSFLTREHNIFRLKWMLKDAGNSKDSIEINTFLSMLADANGNREQLTKLLSTLSVDSLINSDSAGINKMIADNFSTLSSSSKTIIKDAVADLQQMLNDIPDTSLNMDWEFLCRTIQYDLAQTPSKTLNELNALRENLLNKNNARIFIVGSQSTIKKIMPGINKMLSTFESKPSIKQNYSSEKMIDERVKARLHTNEAPVFVGLVDADMPTGVIINSAPLTSLGDTVETQLLKFLAAELYSGAGRESIYTKIVASGLSYGGGVWASPFNAMAGYFAQKTPELPQTLRFVINEIKRSALDTTMTDYVVSMAIGYTRAASEYETRGEAMASNLADNLQPETVKRFRLSILQLRNKPGVINDIYKYKDTVYERILPGYGIALKKVTGGCYFVIGSEKQMALYEAYLKSAEGNDATLFRLYPRDFWMVNDK